jgi:hypothetical protein
VILPCDQCGGQGETYAAMPMADGSVRVTVGHDPRPCPRCVGMPWLRPGTFGDWYADQSMMYPPRWALDSQRVKPDPDTVMRWCFTHGSPFHWTNAEESFGPRCDYYRIVQTPGSTHPDLGKCEVGWVPRPIERLEEAR